MTPWENIMFKNGCVTAYIDSYPVSEGHLLFVPDNDDVEQIAMCFREALIEGNRLIDVGKCNGFNIGMNFGLSAGQTVPHPHVHLIPRRSGDSEDPVGGIRKCVNGVGSYE